MLNKTGKNSSPYDIIFIGNYTKDTIISPSGTRHVDGGGFNYGAHAAVLIGLRVAAVTRLAKEDFHVVKALERIGVNVFPRVTLTSTHMRLEYPTSNMDNRVLYCTQFAGNFKPDQIEDLQAKVFVINTSIRGEASIEFIEEIRKKNTCLTADVQGFVRTIGLEDEVISTSWAEKKQVLPQLDILKVDAVEAEFLTGETDIKVAAGALADLGPREVVVTHAGGVLTYAEGQYHEAPFYHSKLVGRSGRGDTCIASYVAKRLTVSPEEATVWAAAVTSLKMESEGPIRREIGEVKDLIKRKYRSE